MIGGMLIDQEVVHLIRAPDTRCVKVLKENVMDTDDVRCSCKEISKFYKFLRSGNKVALGQWLWLSCKRSHFRYQFSVV